MMQKWDFVFKEPINKGWSSDKKYCVATKDSTKYFLRVSPQDKYDNRAQMYQLEKQLDALGISMSKAVDFRHSKEESFMLYTWIDGEDAENVIPNLPRAQQYSYGLEAGRILKVIHSIPTPTNQADWETRFNAKLDRNIRLYNECSIKFDGAQAILFYIDSNRKLLSGRPQCFQHGDYHIGNMMIEKGKIVIIDFDRYDFGDPWEEFNRIVWSAQASPAFASGIINGYFNNQVPTAFWKLLALYICSNTLSSISWAISFGPKEVAVMQEQAKQVLNWYNNMQNYVPAWYIV